MMKQTFAAAAVALLAAGCSLQPTYQRPNAPVSATFPQGGVYAAQPGQPSNATAAVDIGWRNFFADPRLQRIEELALKNNRDLRVSMLNVEAAQARYQITRAALFPSIDAAASKDRSRTPLDLSSSGRTVSTTYSVGLSASWEIDFFGKLRSLKDEALAQYLSTAETRKAAQLSLLSAVATQYLTMLAFDDQLTVTRNTQTNAQESFRITKLQFDTGTGSELDLRQAEGILEQASANLQSQLRLRAQAENALVLLVGQPLPDDLPQGMPLDSQNLLADIPAGLPSDLLVRRPDIAAAEQTLRAADADIGAARAAFFPEISLTSTLGTLSPSFGGLFASGSRAWSFAPQVSVPIFAGGSNVANLQLAKVEKRIEIANYEKAIQTAFREVADGLAARGTYDNQIASLERDTASQDRRLELSNLRYHNGVDNYLAVLTAQTDLYNAQLLLINARLERLTNLVDLYQALGGGWIEHTGDQPRPADAVADDGVDAQAKAGQ
jgi:multidrug efflux system outer membrane protein